VAATQVSFADAAPHGAMLPTADKALARAGAAAPVAAAGAVRAGQRLPSPAEARSAHQPARRALEDRIGVQLDHRQRSADQVGREVEHGPTVEGQHASAVRVEFSLS
jgi:hypothetical protein